MNGLAERWLERAEVAIGTKVRMTPNFENPYPHQQCPHQQKASTTVLWQKDKSRLFSSDLSRFSGLYRVAFESVSGGRCRIRTCDFHRVKVALYR